MILRTHIDYKTSGACAILGVSAIHTFVLKVVIGQKKSQQDIEVGKRGSRDRPAVRSALVTRGG